MYACSTIELKINHCSSNSCGYNFVHDVYFQCTYPLGLDDPSGMIVNRKFTEISGPKHKPKSNTSQKKSNDVAANKSPRLPCSNPLIATPSASTLAIGKLGTQTMINCNKKDKVLAPYVVGKSSASNSLNSTLIEKNCTDLKDASGKENFTIGLDVVNNYANVSLNSMMYPQWQNKDALCWLDVVMCLFVHSKRLQEVASDSKSGMSAEQQSLLIVLVKAYNQACSLINSKAREAVASKTSSENHKRQSKNHGGLLAKEPSCEESDMTNHFQKMSVQDETRIKTGAGLSISSDFNENLSVYMHKEFSQAFTILNNIREKLFQYLQPKLKCIKGKNDSPVFAIPLLLKGSSMGERMTSMSYSFQLVCGVCGYRKRDDYTKTLPTLPNTVPDFTMAAPAFSRPCFRCDAPNQRRVMQYER